jgi:ubiquitin carboxyl-terminal hydrolase 5/13
VAGRRQGEVGGNSHAVHHAEQVGHQLVVKLGTITPEGHADVHCYLCEEERADPRLDRHLAHFGMDVARAVKTEQTMEEMDLDRNLNFSVRGNIDDGQVCVPLFGPGYTGLQNLGNRSV